MGKHRDIFYPPENGSGGGFPHPLKCDCRECKRERTPEWVKRAEANALVAKELA